MPNRYVRETAIESSRINSLSWQAEVFWRRLLNRVDDFGRYTANPDLLRAALFPLQLDQVSVVDVERLLAECEAARLLSTHIGREGKRFLALHKWEKGRAIQSRFDDPPPDVAARLEPYRDRRAQTSVGRYKRPLTGTDNCEQAPTCDETPQQGSSQQAPTLADNCWHVSADVPDSGSDSGSDAGPDSDARLRTRACAREPDAPKGTRAPMSPSACPSASGKGTDDSPDPPGLPEVLDFARGGAGIDPKVAETWWHEVEGRGWRDGRGQPIDPRRWRNALTAYALKWRANERRPSGDRSPLPRLVENIQIKELT